MSQSGQKPCQKWITASQSNNKTVLKLYENVGQEFMNVSPGVAPVNVLSIFGAARQGKSFMMSCFAGDKVFPVSNQQKPCTQGIDIGTRLMDLNQFVQLDCVRSKASSSNLTASTSTSTKVAFVDAEGQGDQDVNYDANIVCPVLLCSKCVLFNWKDTLQKDKLLNMLGIMCQAAAHVVHTEHTVHPPPGGRSSTFIASSSKKKIFGHLHIMFRDWQQVGTKESVYDDLFTKEHSSAKGNDGVTIRNAIRETLFASFESISVWLFPMPVSDFSLLTSAPLTPAVTSPAFQNVFASLKKQIVLQLHSPMKFGGEVPITTRNLGHIMKQVTHLLNIGEKVCPTSAYENILQQQITLQREGFITSLREQANLLLEQRKEEWVVLKSQYEGLVLASLASANSEKGALLPSVADMMQQLSSCFAPLVSFYYKKVQDVIGPELLESGVGIRILEQCKKDMHEQSPIQQEIMNKFLSQYKPLHQSSLDLALNVTKRSYPGWINTVMPSVTSVSTVNFTPENVSAKVPRLLLQPPALLDDISVQLCISSDSQLKFIMEVEQLVERLFRHQKESPSSKTLKHSKDHAVGSVDAVTSALMTLIQSKLSQHVTAMTTYSNTMTECVRKHASAMCSDIEETIATFDHNSTANMSGYSLNNVAKLLNTHYQMHSKELKSTCESSIPPSVQAILLGICWPEVNKVFQQVCKQLNDQVGVYYKQLVRSFLRRSTKEALTTLANIMSMDQIHDGSALSEESIENMGAMGVVKKDVVSIRDCVTVQQVDEECEQCGYNCVESVKKLSEEAGWEHDEAMTAEMIEMPIKEYVVVLKREQQQRWFDLQDERKAKRRRQETENERQLMMQLEQEKQKEKEAVQRQNQQKLYEEQRRREFLALQEAAVKQQEEEADSSEGEVEMDEPAPVKRGGRRVVGKASTKTTTTKAVTAKAIKSKMPALTVEEQRENAKNWKNSMYGSSSNSTVAKKGKAGKSAAELLEELEQAQQLEQETVAAAKFKKQAAIEEQKRKAQEWRVKQGLKSDADHVSATADAGRGNKRKTGKSVDVPASPTEKPTAAARKMSKAGTSSSVTPPPPPLTRNEIIEQAKKQAREKQRK